MNDAIRPLERDRIRILSALQALEQYVEAVSSGAETSADKLSDFTRFFRLFGDVHFATKIDDILLPDLVRCESGLDMDVVSAVRAAHELQAYHLQTMEQHALAHEPHDEASRRELSSRVGAFVDSQRQVCSTLAEEVFPLVDVMSPEQQQDLQVELEQFDRASIGRQERAEMGELYEQLMGAEAAAAVVSSRRTPALGRESLSTIDV